METQSWATRVSPQTSTRPGGEQTFFLRGEYCYVYLRFPLTDIPAGTHIPYAKLHLKIHPNSTAQGLKIWEQMVNPSYTWTQASLTWDNAPSPDQNAPSIRDLLLSGYTGEGRRMYWISLPSSSTRLTKATLYLISSSVTST
jgi:hypothetical protein